MSRVSYDDSHYAISSKEITPEFNAAVGVSGILPSAQLSYRKSGLDQNGEGMMVAAGVSAVLGRGVEAGASVVQRWQVPVDDNHLDVRVGAGVSMTTRGGGQFAATAGVRADYMRGHDKLSPYFTAVASTKQGDELTIGAGACTNSKVLGGMDLTYCGGVEMQAGERPAPAFSIGRRF